VADRGLYRLQASSEEGEEWAYFTLNVKGEAIFAMRIMGPFQVNQIFSTFEPDPLGFFFQIWLIACITADS
jgi:hypothetical protein